jgi:UDP-N-acetylmuramate--alanine ligase
VKSKSTTDVASRIPEKLHFIGIGGIGMSALAEVALARQCKVSGSDPTPSRLTRRLADLGAFITTVQDGSAIEGDATVVVTSAIKPDNLELVRAQDLGCPIVHRSELLSWLMEGKRTITVAGTHGKTTTTAMIGHVLEVLGEDPTIITGGVMPTVGSPVKVGKSQLIVAEADESDGSFLRYTPLISVLTNIDRDHMEFFGNDERLIDTFRQYLKRTHPDGTSIIGWDSPLSRNIGADLSINKLGFGFVLGCDVRATGFCPRRDGSTFTAVVERDAVEVNLPMFGKHNAANALCALAVARALGLNIQRAASALTSFPGVGRRMSLVTIRGNCRIFDDYAHNPGKISACISSVREASPTERILVIYQSHRYSRLETMYEDLLGAFGAASEVAVLPVYSAGEPHRDGYEAPKLAADMAKFSKVSTKAVMSLEDAVQWTLALLGDFSEPTTVITVGAGDVWKVAEKLAQAMD